MKRKIQEKMLARVIEFETYKDWGDCRLPEKILKDISHDMYKRGLKKYRKFYREVFKKGLIWEDKEGFMQTSISSENLIRKFYKSYGKNI